MDSTPDRRGEKWITDFTDVHRFQKRGDGFAGFSGFQRGTFLKIAQSRRLLQSEIAQSLSVFICEICDLPLLW
jgi:hypothetical protein